MNFKNVFFVAATTLLCFTLSEADTKRGASCQFIFQFLGFPPYVSGRLPGFVQPTTETPTSTPAAPCVPGPVMGCVAGRSRAMCDAATNACPAGLLPFHYEMCYENGPCHNDPGVHQCSCPNW